MCRLSTAGDPASPEDTLERIGSAGDNDEMHPESGMNGAPREGMKPPELHLLAFSLASFLSLNSPTLNLLRFAHHARTNPPLMAI